MNKDDYEILDENALISGITLLMRKADHKFTKDDMSDNTDEGLRNYVDNYFLPEFYKEYILLVKDVMEEVLKLKVSDVFFDIMKEVTDNFLKYGGGTRHYVRDWFLPAIDEHEYIIVLKRSNQLS